jgi:hypothetical protein
LRTNIEAKLLLNNKHCISWNKKIEDSEVYEIKKNIRFHMQDDLEDHIREEETSNNGGTSEKDTEDDNSG